MASADGSQYGGLYEYKKCQEEAVALCLEDLLAVNKAGVLCVDDQEGEEKNLQGRLNGFSERTKERGDFPGMYIQYLGPGRTSATMLKPRPRPLPPTPTWTPSSHTQEQSGQMDSVDQLNHPEQALLVVMKLVEALGKKGLHNEALYQSSPGFCVDSRLKQNLLTDLARVELDSFDGLTLAEILKCYLKELPCPVIHPAIYNELLFMGQGEEYGQRIKLLLETPCLSQWQRLLLQHLSRHFYKLCQNSSKKHLIPRILGEAFSEVLFRPTSASMEMNPERVKIIEALIAAGEVSENQDAPGQLQSAIRSK